MQYFGFDRPSFGIKTYGFGSSEFSPLELFAGGKQGVWYDPSDKSTLFQDVAGTVPVTKDGDPVALMRDKSGNSNHAVQTASAARPTYKTDGILHWLDFDGVDDSLLSGISGLSEDMVWAVGASTTNDGYLLTHSTGIDNRLGLVKSLGQVSFVHYNGTDYKAAAKTLETTPFIVVASIKLSTRALGIYVSGGGVNYELTSGLDYGTYGGMLIGRKGSVGTAVCTTMKLHSLVRVDSALADNTSLLEYVSIKAGVTL